MRNERLSILLVAVAAVGMFAGCRDHMPHSATWPYGGDQIPSHPNPPEGGYYTNWDPFAQRIEVTPVVDVNPVNTQHVFVATVYDAEGKPLPNRRVEWMIAPGSVGTFVEVDESGWRASRGWKDNNTFAVTHTNNGDHVLTRGNDDPSDDVVLHKGQTWAVITSPVEGTSHVIAYAPGIYDWSKHKVFVKKHWYDVEIQYPPAATNPIGTDHTFVTKVHKVSDGKPLQGYKVTYKLLSGPAGSFAGDGQTKTVTTDAQGHAAVTLQQAKPAEGLNKVEVSVVRPENKRCCKPAVHLGKGHTSKRWIGPKIAISKSAPARALVGQKFQYDIVVRNPSKVAATNVTVTDKLPDGIQYDSSKPRAKRRGQNMTFDLGTLQGGGSERISVTVHATKTGTFKNCADVTANHGLKDRDCATTKVAQAALKVTKTGPAEALICEPITYEAVVTNTGSAPAENVKFEDKLPSGLLYQGKFKVLQSDLGTLAPGASKTLRYTVKASKTGNFTNTGVATAEGGLEASDSHRLTVKQPVLVITKTASKTRYVGTQFTYKLSVKNTGDGEARNTVLEDKLPSGVSLLKASDKPSHSGGTLTWNLGTLKPGASRNVTVTVKADSLGTQENYAAVRAVCAKASTKAVTEVKGIPAILLECVDLKDPLMVGDTETYVIAVTNQGSAVGTGIVIKVTLPKQLDLVSASGPTKHTQRGKTVTFAPLGQLAPKAKATYRLNAKATGTGDVRFKVSLTSDQMDSPAEETESTHIFSAE
jgi:uncharacterized repeat protein (TIGR01451 family)